MADPFLSEIKYRGGADLDFIEVAVDAGTDVSDLVVTVYRSNGTIRSSNDLSLLSPTTVNGFDVYVIEAGDATEFNGVSTSQAISLSDDTTVYQFISFDDTSGTVTATQGPANGLTSTDVGQAGAGASLETQDQGGTYFTQNTPDPNNVTCFVHGTLIETDAGLVPVETLAQGARVLTKDGCYKPLRMILHRRIAKTQLENNPALWPVRICAGALGHNIPQSDLCVSRQHRMLVSSPITQRMFGRSEALVAAVRLTALPGVFVEDPGEAVTYYHLLFDAHEVIFANGAPTESFFLGPVAMRTLPRKSVDEITQIFPDLRLPMQVADSRHLIPKKRQQTRLVARHRRNQKCLVTPV